MKIKPRKSREMGHMRVRGTDIFQNYNGHYGVPRKHFFQNWIKSNPPSISQGRNQKGFFISTKLKESSSHFCFDHFYIVDFHSALTFAKRDLRREDWVKIYKLTLDKGLISGESADVVEKLFHGTFPTWLWWINILNIMMLVKLGLILIFPWENQ